MRSLFPALLFVFFASGCGERDDFSTTTTGRGIINGTVDTDSSHDAVPFVYNSDGYACGGTLITQNVVLTAGHCVANQNTSTPASASKFSVFFCQDMTSCNLTDRSRDVIQVYLHPSYNNNNTSYDMGMLRLSSPAPGDVNPIPILPASSVISSGDIGMSVDFIGFGLTNGYDDTSTSDVRRIFTGSIAGVCSSSSSCSTGGWSSYPIAPYTFYTYQDDGGTCQGDSGGPGLVSRNGVTYVGGITSYGFEYCTGPGVYTSVGYYESEINSFINNPPVENCTDGIDNNGDGMADCADPDCAGTSSCPDMACGYQNFLSCNKTVSGNTADGVAAFSTYNCLSSGTENGSEFAYYLSIPPDAVATFTLTNLEQDLDLFILEGDNESCSSQSCVGASVENDLANESLTYTMGETPAYLIVESYNYPGTYSLSVSCDFPPENCSNGIDDDGDFKIDCADPDCSDLPECEEVIPETECDDGLDNDNDGQVDCSDSDCQGEAVCQGKFEIFCSNLKDDDEDGLVDCDDPDCTATDYCISQNNNTSSSSDSGCSSSGGNKGSIPVSLLILVFSMTAIGLRRKYFLSR
ncbi:MAG: trypsin-like serine protease [Deltaproteobacteria bacterium]|nr:trypsin-like serine protease [Deltaproteobacteria bacterium]